MKKNKYFKYLILRFFIYSIIFFLSIIYFKDIFKMNKIILDLSFKKIEINNENNLLFKIKELWIIIFYVNIFILLYTYYMKYSKIINNELMKNLMKKKNIKKENKISDNDINLILGLNKNNEVFAIKDKGIFQNILITGSIGTGKTQAAIYPMLETLIKYKHKNDDEKIAFLILDVKGNLFDKVFEISKKYKREKDIIKIDLSMEEKYNPLDKENLKPHVLADRLKTVLKLFSPETSESYWLDKVEQLILEVIKYIRIYNDNYVDFNELYKIIFDENYYYIKKKDIKKKIYSNLLTKEEIYNLNTFFNFFEQEFLKMDERNIGIIKSELSRIINIFISDYHINRTFCPKKEEITFKGFNEVINKGKIVVLNMNISENSIISKIIATYLKLDFQTEVMRRLQNNTNNRISAFICDEYQEYVSKIDANFYSQSREAKCINIIATQSYSSLKNTLKDENATNVIISCLINKIWFRNDDIYTIESAVKQIGKIHRTQVNKTISENSKETNYNKLLNSFISSDTNISESINTSKNLEDIFDNKYFSQKLETFEAICFISNGEKILFPEKIKLIPHFKRKEIYE